MYLWFAKAFTSETSEDRHKIIRIAIRKGVFELPCIIMDSTNQNYLQYVSHNDIRFHCNDVIYEFNQ